MGFRKSLFGKGNLWKAAWKGRTEVVKLLLEQGAEVDVKHFDHSTPVGRFSERSRGGGQTLAGQRR